MEGNRKEEKMKPKRVKIAVPSPIPKGDGIPPKKPGKPSAAQIAAAKVRREEELKASRKAKRVMLVSCMGAAFSVLVWLVAISTDQWYNTSLPPKSSNSSDSTEPVLTTGSVFLRSNTGLFRTCRVTLSQSQDEKTICKYHRLFPSREEIKRNPELDEHVIDYHRTQLTFAVLSLLLMLLSLSSAFYTFKNGRYMYKRLAAGLYFISAGCILVVQEAVVTCLHYEILKVPFLCPPGSDSHYGFSFYLGWSVFLLYLSNGAVFLVYSRKKKGFITAGQQDDESTILGR